MAEKKMVRVTVLTAFPLPGVGIVAPGERDVPEAMVERLVKAKIIVAPDGSASSGQAEDAARIEAALNRLSDAAPAQGKRREGESAADYIERLAGMTVDGQRASSAEISGGGKVDDLPEGFPARDKLAAAKITTYAQLAAVDDDFLDKNVKGLGPVTIKEIRAAEKSRGK